MSNNNVFSSPTEKINSLRKQKTTTQQYREYEPVKEDVKKNIPKGEGLKKMIDNIRFTNTVNDSPVMLKKTYRGYTHRVMDFSHFLNLRLYPRSIYTTDKLLRLVASSTLEQLKKYLSKKRKVPIDALFVVLIIVGVVAVVMVILFLVLPLLGL